MSHLRHQRTFLAKLRVLQKQLHARANIKYSRRCTRAIQPTMSSRAEMGNQVRVAHLEPEELPARRAEPITPRDQLIQPIKAKRSLRQARVTKEIFMTGVVEAGMDIEEFGLVKLLHHRFIARYRDSFQFSSRGPQGCGS